MVVRTDASLGDIWYRVTYASPTGKKQDDAMVVERYEVIKINRCGVRVRNLATKMERSVIYDNAVHPFASPSMKEALESFCSRTKQLIISQMSTIERSCHNLEQADMALKALASQTAGEAA